MMKTLFIGLCLTGLVFASKVELIEDLESWDLEHPLYNVTANQPKDGSYEIRSYESAKWASTVVRSISGDKARIIGFRRLFKYIRGANDRGIELDMTVPVTTEIQANPCVFCRSNYTVSFYIPSLYQDDPPQPTSEDVFIDTRPVMEFYVKYFGGMASLESSRDVAYRLATDLFRNNVTKSGVASDRMWIAEYSSPMRRWHRHNEIWFLARNGEGYFGETGFEEETFGFDY